MKRIALILISLGATSAVIAQSPPVAQLGLLPGDAAIAPAVSSQQDHSIAAGGDQYLVAWSDMRGRSAGSQSIQSDGDIFGIRLNAAGAPLGAPFLIAGGMGLQRYPTVAWNGQNWLVIYQSQDPVGGYFDTQIRAVRVSPAGLILDATPILLPPTQFSPSTIGMTVAGQNGQWLVTRCVYHSDGYGTYLAGQRISGNGQLLDANPIMLNDWVYGTTRTVVANGEYLVVGPDWNNSSTIKGRRVGQNAQPIGTSFTIPSLTLASNGSEYYVTWISNYTNIVGSRMTSTGTLLNPAGTLLFSDPSVSYYHTNLTHDGINWWFEWGAASSLRTLRIGPTGNVLDSGGVQLPIGIGGITQAYGVQLVAAAGGGVQVAWWDGRPALGGDANVFALPISAGNVPGVEQCVSTGTTNHRNPDFSGGSGGTGAIVLVSEAANDDRVLMHLLSPAGTPTGAEPIEVHRGPNIGKAGIAWNGSMFMVAWDEGPSGSSTTQIMARRIDSEGVFIDAAPISVMAGFNADVEALGDDFLVASARYGTYPQNIYLMANRIDGPTGAVLDGSGLFVGGWYVNAMPRVRSDGTQWFVCAHSMWSHDSSQSDAIMARVPAVGPPSQAGNPTPVSGGSGDPDIAFSGNKYLLVWRMNSLANANNYIAGRIMNADGTFAPGYFTIAEAPGRQIRPTVVWDGSAFVVAWEDQRNQAAFFDARTDIYATRVSENGEILDNPAFPLIRTPDGDAAVALLSRGDGMTLAAAGCFVTDGVYSTYRVALARIGASATPPGDVDGDGDVDLGDLAAVLASFGLCTGDAAFNAAADIDASGCVELGDLAVLLAHFGT